MLNLNRLETVLKGSDLLTEQLIEVEKLKKRFSENELIISVIGQFKRGKSSLINSMMNEDILPVGIIPLTTAVTEIRYAPKFAAAVIFENGEQKEITADELVEYCSEEKNPQNKKCVSVVRLFTPNQPFGEGIVLVDTPGVGSVNKSNTDSSNDYVKNSDAVIFLLSVDSPVSEIERAFLLRTADYAEKFFFAVNKSDTVSSDDLETFTAYCKGVISQTMQREVELCPVSAKSGRGVAELVKRLNTDLEKSKNSLLEKSVMKKLSIVIKQAEVKLELALKTAAIPADELKTKLEHIQQKREELNGFSEEINVLAQYRTDNLVDCIKTDFDARAEQMKKETQNKCTETYERFKEKSVKDFENTMRKTLEDYLKATLGELNRDGLSALEKGYGEIMGLLSEKAYEAACFTAELLKQEFELDYPVSRTRFEVSKRSDFLMHIGANGTLLMNMDSIARLLPKRIANERYYKQSVAQSINDVERNKNNMLYNYRYKMKESLRTPCSDLTERVNGIAKELDGIITHIENNLTAVDRNGKAEEERIKSMLEELKLAENELEE